MAPRNRYPRSRDGPNMDDTPSTIAEELEKEFSIRMRYRFIRFIIFVVYCVFILFLGIKLHFKPLFSSAISTTSSFIFMIGLLRPLLVLSYYVFLFRGALVWWLHMKITAWHARACVSIFNWKNACAAFAKKLFRPTTGRENVELTYFKWTCVSPHTFARTGSMSCGA